LLRENAFMPTTVVSSGVTSSGLTVSSGVQVQVLSGGEVVSAIVASGGTLNLSSGAESIDVAVSSGGGSRAQEL
jgi:autotransporter passenger strand-loop-strand repeat protein